MRHVRHVRFWGVANSPSTNNDPTHHGVNDLCKCSNTCSVVQRTNCGNMLCKLRCLMCGVRVSQDPDKSRLGGWDPSFCVECCVLQVCCMLFVVMCVCDALCFKTSQITSCKNNGNIPQHTHTAKKTKHNHAMQQKHLKHATPIPLPETQTYHKQTKEPEHTTKNKTYPSNWDKAEHNMKGSPVCLEMHPISVHEDFKDKVARQQQKSWVGAVVWSH